MSQQSENRTNPPGTQELENNPGAESSEQGQRSGEETPFRPLTRVERRNLWLKEYGEPETADALKEYYVALVPPSDQPEIGPEGLPVVFRAVHMRDVTIMSGGHKIKVPYWRGKISEVDAFVIGATAGE